MVIVPVVLLTGFPGAFFVTKELSLILDFS